MAAGVSHHTTSPLGSIPLVVARLCNLERLLLLVETNHSDVATHPFPSADAAVTLGARQGLGWGPETCRLAHMNNVFSQELCQGTSSHSLIQSKPSPALLLIIEAP